MSKYIVIPNIEILNANAQPVWWIVSAPAITAYVGFAHALALSLGAKKHDGVAIIHHNIQFLGETFGNNFHPNQFRASGFIDKDDYSSKNKYALSSQPTARCHLNISLVIALPNETVIEGSKVEKFLRQARLAGGSIINFGEIKYDVKSHDQAKASIKYGYSIIDRQDLMIKQGNDRDMIDVLLRNTRRIRYHIDLMSNSSRKTNILYIASCKESLEYEIIDIDGELKQGSTQWDKLPNNFPKESQDTQILKDFLPNLLKLISEAGHINKSESWLVPSCLGYAGISSLKERKKSRNNLPHLYVEPLVGLIQYRKMKDVGLHFWRYCHPKNNLFILTTNN